MGRTVGEAASCGAVPDEGCDRRGQALGATRADPCRRSPSCSPRGLWSPAGVTNGNEAQLAARSTHPAHTWERGGSRGQSPPRVRAVSGRETMPPARQWGREGSSPAASAEATCHRRDRTSVLGDGEGKHLAVLEAHGGTSGDEPAARTVPPAADASASRLALAAAVSCLSLNRNAGARAPRPPTRGWKAGCPGSAAPPCSTSGSITWPRRGRWSWKAWPTTGRACASGGGWRLRRLRVPGAPCAWRVHLLCRAPRTPRAGRRLLPVWAFGAGAAPSSLRVGEVHPGGWGVGPTDADRRSLVRQRALCVTPCQVPRRRCLCYSLPGPRGDFVGGVRGQRAQDPGQRWATRVQTPGPRPPCTAAVTQW